MTTAIKVRNDRFDVLLERWTSHQHLRDQGATIAELATSRAKLDSARLIARSHIHRSERQN